MALIELKAYKPVCDTCGKVGSTWQGLPEHRMYEAVPEGWLSFSHERKQELILKCDECVKKKEDQANHER